MGCCSSSDKHSISAVGFHEVPTSETLKYDKNFKGPLSKRSCTDVSCLLIFIIFLGCWGYIGHWAIKNGDLDRLLVPTDSEGRKCGIDNGVIDKPYLVFFNLEKCIDPTVPLFGCRTPQVCVERCPTESFLYAEHTCNGQSWQHIRDQLICKMDVDKRTIDSCATITRLVETEQCARWYMPSNSFSRRCVPLNITQIIEVASQTGYNLTKIIDHPEKLPIAVGYLKDWSTINGIGQKIVEDVMATWDSTLYGLLLAMISCLILIALMRWIARPLVWLSILGVIVVFGYATYYAFTRWNYLRKLPPGDVNTHTNLGKVAETLLQKPQTWLYSGIVIAVVLVIILLVVLVLRKRIVIAIALVKEGSKAVSSIYSTVFFPIFPWIFQVVVFSFAVVVFLHLSSVGTPVNQVIRMNNDTECQCSGPAVNYTDGVICDPKLFNEYCRDVKTFSGASQAKCRIAACNFKGIQSPDYVKYFQALNVFGFFWGVFFVTALGEMVLAATFATWYWTFHKSDVPFFTLTHGLGRTVRYHLGTVAFGSLIITICRVIRVILEYIDEKLKKWDNEFSKCLLCCLKCFFWCLENFLRFINKNAYIMCAIHGKPFCTSARDAFNLLMRNFLRVVALDKVTEFLFFLTKILVTVGMGAVAYVYFTREYADEQLHYVQVPVVLIMIGTWLIASVFFGVYSMAVDTLFLCFLEDCERNDGSEEKPYFMSKQLMKILGKKNLIPREQYH